MKPICITIVDSDVELDAESDIEFDLITGHKDDCDWKKTSNRPIDGIKALCSGKTKNDKPCAKALCPQSCLDIEDDILIGKCALHWKKSCEGTNWNHSLSICANKKCDSLKMNFKSRSKIDQFNIKKKLNLPAEVKFNHISGSRRKMANTKIKSDPVPDSNPDDVSSSDDASKSDNDSDSSSGDASKSNNDSNSSWDLTDLLKRKITSTDNSPNKKQRKMIIIDDDEYY